MPVVAASVLTVNNSPLSDLLTVKPSTNDPCVESYAQAINNDVISMYYSIL